jgi:class 3 adenylate cyclase
MLFTDIEGSTTMVRTLGTDRWETVLEIHSRIIREALPGVEFEVTHQPRPQ